MKLSIIIVHYKVKDELFHCIQSIKNSYIQYDYEIIVVDNDEEKTIEKELKKKFPVVTYIKSPSNIGFGAGNNLGAKYAKGEYLFFLNPDTIVSKHAIDKLILFLDKQKQAAVVAPLLVNPQGNPYPFQGTKKLTPLRGIIALSFINKFFPGNPISKEYWLKDWNKHSTQEVDVIPGTAFMIHAAIFKKVHQFDEHFFMYYEEHDLCNRIKKLGLSLFIIPAAKITHAWGSSTKKSKKNINAIFSRSQFYYFKKHYGIVWAILVKLITEFGKEQLLFLFILALGIFLRLYRIEENFGFDGEVGDNLLDIKNAFFHHQIPLKGAPTSHPWLSFGPLFYWLYAPLLILSKFNPMSHAYFGAGIAILTIVVNYIFIKKLFSKTTAFISTFLITISPLYLSISRLGRFTYIVSLLIYPFFWMLNKVITGEKKYFFWLCFTFGIMLNFHYTPLFLIPAIITIFVLKKIRFTVKEIIYGICGFLLPLFPLILYDFQYKTNMIKNFSLWIPYRILGFFGWYHKNTFSGYVLHENTVSFMNFFSSSFTPTSYNSYTFTGIVIFSIIFVFLIWQCRMFIKNKALPAHWFIMLVWIGFGFLALFIHGSAPLHYFVGLFPFPILFFSFFLTHIWKEKFGKMLVCIVLLLITINNFLYFFSKQWYYMPENKTPYADGSLSYEGHKKIAQFIVQNTSGKPYELKRVGYNDTFDKQFAQNYIYLLWYYGNEPVKKANITYTIVEDGTKFNRTKKKNLKMYIINNVIILKEIK